MLPSFDMSTSWDDFVENLSDNLPISADITVTVGSGGDYPTINAALEALSRKYPLYKKSGHTVEVKLLSGFVMQEQVFVVGLDLGWITITSEAAEVTISREALTEIEPSGRTVGHQWGGRPAFSVFNGTLPVIDVLFNMDTSGPDPVELNAGQHGIHVASSSRAYIKPGAGIKNCTGRALFVVQSTVDARDTIWDNAVNVGVYATDGALVSVRFASAKDSDDVGIYANNCATIDAQGADASGADRNGFYANTCSMLDAREANAENCGYNGVRAIRNSLINCDETNVSGSEYGIYARTSSTINAREALANNCTATGVFAEEAATINASNATVNGSGVDGIFAQTGSYINANSVTCEGSGNVNIYARGGSRINAELAQAKNAVVDGMLALDGSCINARSSNTTGAGTNGYRVNWGGIISAQGATGTVAQTVNTIAATGIIFQST